MVIEFVFIVFIGFVELNQVNIERIQDAARLSCFGRQNSGQSALAGFIFNQVKIFVFNLSRPVLDIEMALNLLSACLTDALSY